MNEGGCVCPIKVDPTTKSKHKFCFISVHILGLWVWAQLYHKMLQLTLASPTGICLSECPPNSVFTHWELVDGTCYGIVKKSPSFLSAYDARESCLSFGGDIADITDSKLYSLTVSIMAQMPEVRSVCVKACSHRRRIGIRSVPSKVGELSHISMTIHLLNLGRMPIRGFVAGRPSVYSQFFVSKTECSCQLICNRRILKPDSTCKLWWR